MQTVNHPKGELEKRGGKWLVWCGALGGYVTSGGFSQNPRKAIKYKGPGHAIYVARCLGFAILGW